MVCKILFTVGCNTIVSGVTATGYGVPANNPNSIVEYVKSMYNIRYNEGKESAQPHFIKYKSIDNTTSLSLNVVLTYDIKTDYPDIYNKLTVDNFFLNIRNMHINLRNGGYNDNMDYSPTKSYVPSTGILSISKVMTRPHWVDNDGQYHWTQINYTFDIYIVY